MGSGHSPSAVRRLLGATLRIVRRTTSTAGHRVRRAEIGKPLDTGGFLGASVTGWISTSPSFLPRTWWMWSANIGLSQIYGYAAGVLAGKVVRRAIAGIGLEMSIAPDHRRRARWAGAAALIGISTYSWVRGVMRQREISHLVRAEPKGLSTAAVGTVGGVAFSAAALVAVRAVRSTAQLYRAMLRPYLPPRIVGAVSLVLTAVTVGVLVERLIRGRLLEQMIERAEAANRLISPDVPRPVSSLRSGSPASHETWQSLGAPGRKIVSSGASAEQIAAATGEDAQEPIRVYAGKSSARSLEETVEAVIAELDRTGAWEREVLVLFTGTGTGWLQEWSLSAIEFLTGGNCATASLQYSVYTSALSYLVDHRSPRRAGNLLLHAVRRRLKSLPPGQRPRLFVAGESLGSFGGQAAFRDLQEMLASVDGAVWTGTPSFTPLWRELVSRSREGAPAIAPILDDGRHIRVVTREADLHRNYHGGLYAEWKSPRVVYAQHPSDPVVWWQPALLWDEPRWLRERVGHDVTPAMRWFPWITFWQVAADMPLSIKASGGHGHSYHEEMVPIWAAVLGQDAGGALTLVQRRRHQAITEAIRRVHPRG
ncbi:alpha/beta hydrolase [Brachybacterium sp. J153]|uniref:alpha/beta hydrolase n=1 Tax=Brachybacterium sp. J153 TaxID=3116488 RepID=UPI002E77618D|nr:alpha/beta-hydrolase family protein [Brachybacterium sp. J153]MEE1619354.1 alpha/beta-hydrolase family protein [Brachybacterium sp. J153]